VVADPARPGPSDAVAVPELAVSDYDVGARWPGRSATGDSLTQLGPQSPSLVYLNSRVTRPGAFSASITCAR